MKVERLLLQYQLSFVKSNSSNACATVYLCTCGMHVRPSYLFHNDFFYRLPNPK